MDVDQRLAAVAAAISNEARTRILCALSDGRSRTATELAAIAAIAASTASAHLARLEDAKLIECLPSGATATTGSPAPPQPKRSSHC